ncbi:MAG: cytochrome c maturation protein CcmE [Candidatus Solibacter usitatus]|nr:cytochrome c maturation protein CcmE [Candidatus Solibacter usitatus]
MKKYGKFAALIVIIVGTLIWLATASIKDNQTYYKTVVELGQMGDQAYVKRLRVAGDVGAGSIVRKGNAVEFVLVQEALKVKVTYDGAEPLPDTFRDGAQALAEGKMGRDGVFHATRIQAKCASKYEAKPGQKPAADSNKASF